MPEYKFIGNSTITIGQKVVVYIDDEASFMGKIVKGTTNTIVVFSNDSLHYPVLKFKRINRGPYVCEKNNNIKAYILPQYFPQG